MGTGRGLLGWRALGPSRSKVVFLWLAPETRTGVILARLVDEMMSPGPASGCVAFPDRILEIDEALQSRTFRVRGFRHIERIRLRMALESLPVRPSPSGITAREVRPDDRDPLIHLFQRAYGNDIDALFGAHLDPQRDASDYIDQQIIHQALWNQEASFLASSGGVVVGAVLTLRTEPVPLVADLMVDPNFRRQGIGTTLLLDCLRALRAQGDSMAELTVTLDNPNDALGHYQRLGFRLVEDRNLKPAGLWVHRGFLREQGLRVSPEREPL